MYFSTYDPGIEPRPPALVGEFFTATTNWEAHTKHKHVQISAAYKHTYNISETPAPLPLPEPYNGNSSGGWAQRSFCWRRPGLGSWERLWQFIIMQKKRKTSCPFRQKALCYQEEWRGSSEWHCQAVSQESRCFPGGTGIKNPPASAGDTRDVGLIPGSGRSPGGEHGNPLQCSA